MKKVIIPFCCLLMFLLIPACSSGSYVVSERGDVAEIVRIDGFSFDCELICVQDTAIIFSTEYQNKNISPKLCYEPLTNIKSIKIKGYNGSGWLAPLLIFQVLPAGLLTGAALSVDSDNGGAVLVFIIPIVSALLFTGSDEDAPQWTNTQPIEVLTDIKKYCRYPLGISAPLMLQLFKQYNQTGLIKIIKR